MSDSNNMKLVNEYVEMVREKQKEISELKDNINYLETKLDGMEELVRELREELDNV
jgi:predicted  nucleic acid-binding Zn-ribbon protein